MNFKPSAIYWIDRFVSDSPSEASSSTRRGHEETRFWMSESRRVSLHPLKLSRCKLDGKCLHRRTTASLSKFTHATLRLFKCLSELSINTRPSTVMFRHRPRFSVSMFGLPLKCWKVSSSRSRDSRLSLRKDFVWASSLFSEPVSMIVFVRSKHSILRGLK